MITLSDGMGLSQEWTEMAAKVAGPGRFTQLAMGGGQTQEAIYLLKQAASSGEWLGRPLPSRVVSSSQSRLEAISVTKLGFGSSTQEAQKHTKTSWMNLNAKDTAASENHTFILTFNILAIIFQIFCWCRNAVWRQHPFLPPPHPPAVIDVKPSDFEFEGLRGGPDQGVT